MLSRSLVSVIKSSGEQHLRSSVKVLNIIRFNSKSSKEEELSDKPKTKNQGKKIFYDDYVRSLKKDVDQDGYYIKGEFSEETFKQSAYVKHLNKINKEKNELVEKKLRALAEVNNVKYEELKKQFDEKVLSKLNAIKAETTEISKVVSDFTTELSLPFEGSHNIIEDLFDSITKYGENYRDSPAFQYITELDSAFADAFGKVLRKKEPSQDIVNDFSEQLKHGKISSITEDQYLNLKKLLKIEPASSSTSAQVTETVKEKKPSQELEPEIDGQIVLESIFANLNMFENIEKSPLLKLIDEVDPKFATLLKGYETIDPEKETELKNQYEKILNYCSNKDSKIYKAFGDETSPDFSKVKSILEQPMPIDLVEIYECFEYYPDYFTSDAFKSIADIDPKFADLLKELETMPEGEALDKKNDEIDAYLNNTDSPIYVAMNNVDSESFKKLRKVLDTEWEKIESSLTPDKLIEYVAQNGLESDGFKLVKKIDPEFSEILSTLYSSEDTEQAMSIYSKLQEYFQDESTAINEALKNSESLNYKLLSEQILPKEENVLEEIEEVKASENVDPTIKSEVTLKQSEYPEEIQRFKEEDQSELSEDVVKMNKIYEMTMEAVEELQSELESNTFIPLSKKVSSSVQQLLGFQPTTEQIESATPLKGQPLPKQRDEVLELCVNLIMRDGKKESARRNLNRALYLIFLETRKSPVELLKEALDMAAPLVITKTVKTGFAKNYTVPMPLTERQRNRMAFLWILDSCDSKASNDFSVRLAEEILHVLSGKSKLMDKRILNHKMAIANRSYLKI